MTQFWFGFITAVALIAVSIIVLAVCVHRRQERQRQQSVDAIMAKVAAESHGKNSHIIRHPDILAEEQALSRSPNQQGKKGVH